MGLYLGEISYIQDHANFTPHYEYEQNKFTYLNKYEKQALLPESKFGSINFYTTDPDIDIKDVFYAQEFLLFEFEVSDLEDNENSRRERYPVGYKINIQNLPAKKIRHLPDLGYYYCIPTEHIEGNYKSNNALIIHDQNVHRGMKVLIPSDDDSNTLLGPYDVYSSEDAQLIIKINVAKKYIINGFRFDGGYQNKIVELGKLDAPRRYINVDDDCAHMVTIDILPKQELLKSFSDAIGNDDFSDGKVDLQNIGSILEHHKNSLFIGEDIPEEIQAQRFETLTTILTNEENLSDTFDFISDTIGKLLISYQDQEGYADLAKRLSEDSDFMGRIQKVKSISDRIEEREAQVQSLTQQSEALNRQLEEQKKQFEEQKEQEVAAALTEKYEKELHIIQEQKIAKQAEFDELLRRLGVAENIEELQKRKDELADEVKYQQRRSSDLGKEIDKQNESLETIKHRLGDILSDETETAMKLAFDGMLSSKMLRQAAEWENQENIRNYKSIVDSLITLPHSEKKSEDLISDLIKKIQNYRPGYDRNTILNILICISQGFLTVFSGEPGTGKTSICKIIAFVLGLTAPSKLLPAGNGFDPNRFVSVSVERGWTTKRDFVGYYNPLTKTFDRSNRRIYDGLNLLDFEAKGMSTNLPFVILLDEANLSPMEYYWADFMNICDDLDQNSTINLGDDFYYQIPENLRFVATINNDHTTESLSPRLIDRAWVVRLPKVKPGTGRSLDFTKDDAEIISWDSLKETFDVLPSDQVPISGKAKETYETLLLKFQEAKIAVSARADTAIRRYWSVAQHVFEIDSTYDTDPPIVALDYAIAQRILPHINGSGKKYEDKLIAIQKFCSESDLRYSAGILADIIQKGKDAMSYYQYFA